MQKNYLKYLLLIFIFFGLFVFPSAYVAAKEDATQSANRQEKIDLIKEKVASKVAELTKAITVGVEGTIKKIEEGILTVDINGKEKTINTDNNTRIIEQGNTFNTNILKFDDLNKSDDIVIVGEEQIGTDIINAQLIASSPSVIAFSGEVKEINKKKFTFILVETDKEYIFDFEKYTDSMKLMNGKFKDIGFTEIDEGAKVQVLASPQKNSETSFTALRLIVL